MTAKVTIGIPVFNGAATLRRTVESALAQTSPVDLIHISDNASTDSTPDIARTLVRQHPRISLTRQVRSVGLAGNFGFLLQQSRTEYFMWLAADDFIEPTYIEKMMMELDSDPTLVSCVSKGCFVRYDGTTTLTSGTYPLLGDRVSNLAAYLSNPSDNTRIFGLYRTPILQQAFPPRYFHAYDWAIVAGTLRHGRQKEVPEVLIFRQKTPRTDYVRRAHRDHATALGRFFPVLRMTIDVVWRLRIPLRLPIIKALLHVNLCKHIEYALEYHPRYGQRVGRLLRKWVLWRLEPQPPPLS